jgi:ribosomal protein S12
MKWVRYAKKACLTKTANPPIFRFLRKYVMVRLRDGSVMEGFLVAYQDKTNHSPEILILLDGVGYHIIRGGWVYIREARPS